MQSIFSHGIAGGGQVWGIEVISSGGKTTGVEVDSSGTQIISSGGTAAQTTDNT
jgi:autotransporter passenger strand-loop-strand repeat protein